LEGGGCACPLDCDDDDDDGGGGDGDGDGGSDGDGGDGDGGPTECSDAGSDCSGGGGTAPGTEASGWVGPSPVSGSLPDPAAWASLLHEAGLLQAAAHPRVLACVGLVAGPRPPVGPGAAAARCHLPGCTLPFLATEPATASLGQLAGTLGGLPWVEAVAAAADVFAALAHLHALAPPVVHCDVAPGNVLMFGAQRPLRAKLADFGLAQRVGAGDGPGTVAAQGSLWYCAPEVLCGTPGVLVDVYSAGMVLAELLVYRVHFVDPATAPTGPEPDPLPPPPPAHPAPAATSTTCAVGIDLGTVALTPAGDASVSGAREVGPGPDGGGGNGAGHGTPQRAPLARQARSPLADPPPGHLVDVSDAGVLAAQRHVVTAAVQRARVWGLPALAEAVAGCACEDAADRWPAARAAAALHSCLPCWLQGEWVAQGATSGRRGGGVVCSDKGGGGGGDGVGGVDGGDDGGGGGGMEERMCGSMPAAWVPAAALATLPCAPWFAPHAQAAARVEAGLAVGVVAHM
jgi:hypothetical protein